MKRAFSALPAAQRENRPAAAQNAVSTAKLQKSSRFYIITSGDYDSYRIEVSL